MPNVSNDLSQKLYATMEKHKEVETHGWALGGPVLAPFLGCRIEEGARGCRAGPARRR